MAFPPSTIADDKLNATNRQDDHPGHHNLLADAVNETVAELVAGAPSLSGTYVTLATEQTITAKKTFALTGGKCLITLDDETGLVRGIVIERVDQTITQGITLASAGVDHWGAPCLDYVNNNDDVVLIYDMVGAGAAGSGDVLRTSHGGQTMLTFGASSPALTSTSMFKVTVPSGTGGGAPTTLHGIESVIRDASKYNFWARTLKANSKRTMIGLGEPLSDWAIGTDHDDENVSNLFIKDVNLARAVLFCTPAVAKMFIGSNTPTTTKPVPLATLHVRNHAGADLPFLVEKSSSTAGEYAEVRTGPNVADRVFSVGELGILTAGSGGRTLRLKRTDSATFPAGAVEWRTSDDTLKFAVGVNQLVGAGYLEFNYGAVNLAHMETAGDWELVTAGKGYIAKSPNGTRYKLTPPNGGGAAAWAAV